MSESGPQTRRTLASWKEIASFLVREVRTVQRWEKEEGLPVHRHRHQQRNSVYAHSDELREWWESRGHGLPTPPRPGTLWWKTAGLSTVAAAVLALLAVWMWRAGPAADEAATATLDLVVASGPPLVTPGSIAVSPDGLSLYVSDWGARSIFVVPASGGTPRLLASHAASGFFGLENARFLALSPNGATLYVAGWATSSVFSISTTTGEIRLLKAGPPLQRPHGIAVSFDGTFIFVTDNAAGKLFRLRSNGDELVTLGSNLPEPLEVVPAGSWVYVVCGDGNIYSVSEVSGPATLVVSGERLVRPTGVAAASDASALYVVDDAGFGGKPPAVVYEVALPTRRSLRLHRGPPLLFPPDVAVSPDGAHLFVADAGYSAGGAIYRLNLFDTLSIDIVPEPARHAGAHDDVGEQQLAVVVLTTSTLDAADLDQASIRFGPRGATESHGRRHFTDVDADGDTDLLLHFDRTQAGLNCESTRAVLRARTASGRRFAGSAAVPAGTCR